MSFPNTPILDTFARADGPVGSAYSVIGLFGGSAMTIVSNTLAFPAGNNDGYLNATVFGPNAEIYLDVLAATGSYEFYLRMASPGPSFNGYRFRFRQITSECFIYRVDAGVSTQLGSVASLVLSAGDKIGASASGSILTIYQKIGAGAWGVANVQNDAAYSAPGYIGLFGADAGNSADNLGGGTVPFTDILLPMSVSTQLRT